MKESNIILAEDHPLMRKALTQVINYAALALGLSPVVEAVSGGIDLVERVKTGNHQLAFTDFSMRDISGTEAIKQIKAVKPQLPIYLLSTYDLGNVASIMGATGYIDKAGKNAEEQIREALRRTFFEAP